MCWWVWKVGSGAGGRGLWAAHRCSQHRLDGVQPGGSPQAAPMLWKPWHLFHGSWSMRSLVVLGHELATVCVFWDGAQWEPQLKRCPCSCAAGGAREVLREGRRAAGSLWICWMQIVGVLMTWTAGSLVEEVDLSFFVSFEEVCSGHGTQKTTS